MKRLLSSVVAVVLAAALTGGCSDEPDTVSKAEFCGAFQDFYDALGALDTDELGDYVKALKDEAAKVGEVGVPEDMPDHARAGLELTLQSLEELDDDATMQELGSIEEGYTAQQRTEVRAFEEYLAETCPDLGVDG